LNFVDFRIGTCLSESFTDLPKSSVAE